MQLAALVAIGLLALRIVAGKMRVACLNLCVRPEPGGSDIALSEFAEFEEANLFSCETGIRERLTALESDILVAHRHDNE